MELTDDRLGSIWSGFGTSVLGMTPGQPFLETLVTIPFVPGVKAHSIIAVQDPDVPRDEASDGVVKYKSPHIDGVESEYVVVSGHSCQDNPHTIQEVRRILLEHIAAYDAAQGAPPSAHKAPNLKPPSSLSDLGVSSDPTRPPEASGVRAGSGP